MSADLHTDQELANLDRYADEAYGWAYYEAAADRYFQRMGNLAQDVKKLTAQVAALRADRDALKEAEFTERGAKLATRAKLRRAEADRDTLLDALLLIDWDPDGMPADVAEVLARVRSHTGKDPA